MYWPSTDLVLACLAEYKPMTQSLMTESSSESENEKVMMWLSEYTETFLVNRRIFVKRIVGVHEISSWGAFYVKGLKPENLDLHITHSALQEYAYDYF
jgi:hypothetical protein